MKKYILGLTAIVLAVAGSAFTAPKTISAPEMNHKATQTWYYTGTGLSGDRVAANYQTSSIECNTGVQLPCEIQFDASQYMIPASHTPLENYLASFSTDAAVTNAAVSKKSN